MSLVDGSPRFSYVLTDVGDVADLDFGLNFISDSHPNLAFYSIMDTFKTPSIIPIILVAAQKDFLIFIS